MLYLLYYKYNSFTEDKTFATATVSLDKMKKVITNLVSEGKIRLSFGTVGDLINAEIVEINSRLADAFVVAIKDGELIEDVA